MIVPGMLVVLKVDGNAFQLAQIRALYRNILFTLISTGSTFLLVIGRLLLFDVLPLVILELDVLIFNFFS